MQQSWLIHVDKALAFTLIGSKLRESSQSLERFTEEAVCFRRKGALRCMLEFLKGVPYFVGGGGVRAATHTRLRGELKGGEELILQTMVAQTLDCS